MNKGSPDLNVIYDNSYIIIIMYIIRRARPKTIYIYIYIYIYRFIYQTRLLIASGDLLRLLINILYNQK